MYTYPSLEIINQINDAIPDYMYPNLMPWAVISEGYLNRYACDHIVESNKHELAYRFDNCGGETRECRQPLNSSLDPIASFLREANDEHWHYDLGDKPGAWFQTYRDGDAYQLHMDGSLGQTRKLTAIALLTDETTYIGGELKLHIPPHSVIIPKTQGTIVVFPFWVLHDVEKIISGVRRTINLGYWGPPFR